MVRSLVDWITPPRAVVNISVTRLEGCVPVIVGWLPRRPAPSALPRLQCCVAEFGYRLIVDGIRYTEIKIFKYLIGHLVAQAIAVRKLDTCSLAECDAGIQIHGWDSTGWFSHDIVPKAHETAVVLRRLNKAPAAFQGTCHVNGSPSLEFQTTAYDLMDAGLAIVHLNSAPIGALTVLPAHRRCRLRNEFAFGFVAHLSFLDGLINAESELAIHDYVDQLLRTEQSSTLVFTVETACPHSDASIVLSTYLENLSIAMLQWLCANDAMAAKPSCLPAFFG